MGHSKLILLEAIEIFHCYMTFSIRLLENKYFIDKNGLLTSLYKETIRNLEVNQK